MVFTCVSAKDIAAAPEAEKRARRGMQRFRDNDTVAASINEANAKARAFRDKQKSKIAENG